MPCCHSPHALLCLLSLSGGTINKEMSWSHQMVSFIQQHDNTPSSSAYHFFFCCHLCNMSLSSHFYFSRQLLQQEIPTRRHTIQLGVQQCVPHLTPERGGKTHSSRRRTLKSLRRVYLRRMSKWGACACNQTAQIYSSWVMRILSPLALPITDRRWPSFTQMACLPSCCAWLSLFYAALYAEFFKGPMLHPFPGLYFSSKTPVEQPDMINYPKKQHI